MISIVILNYNVCNFLRQCILSVQKATLTVQAEIIVIDNNSVDDSALMMKQEFPEILFIKNKENVGFGVANNQAVAQAKGEYICILNPDTAVAPDVFTKCLAFISQTPDCGAIGVRLIDGAGNFLPESKRNLPTPSVSLSKLIGLNKKSNSYYATHLEEEETGEVSVLVGAFMFMKRSLYRKVGGFDEDYFMYGEDIDLSYKIEKLGYKNYYLGAAKVLHYKGESTQKNKVYLDRFYDAMQIFYKKHFSKNIVMDSIVYAGIFLNKHIKAVTINIKEEKQLKVEVLYLLSKDQLFYEKLKNKYDQPIKQVLLEDLTELDLKNALLIWDAQDYHYGIILDSMRSLSHLKPRHRIRPSAVYQIIGSDSSEERGVSLHL